MIAPIVYILYFYQAKFTKRNAVIFGSGLTFLLYLHFLCGYEYVTTFAIMVVAVALAKLVIDKHNLKKNLFSLSLIGASPIIAMMLAFSTHILALSQQTGSIAKSVEVVKNRAEDRTVHAEYYTQYAYVSLNFVANDFYGASNEYLKYDRLKDSNSIPIAIIVAYAAHLLLPVVNTPFLSGVFASYAHSFAAFLGILLLLYVYRKKWVSKRRSQEVKGLYVGLIVGLAGYFSWLVFAYSHSLVHAHINGILMYLPTALFGFMILGLYIEFLIKKYIQRK
jgi:hypothetical protein